MADTINTQLSHSTAISTLLSIPQEVTGGSLIMRDTLEKCGVTLLGLIRDAFVVKSLGGTDDAGDRWAPLKQSTVESRARKRKGRTTSLSRKRKGENSKVYDKSVRRAKNIIKSRNKGGKTTFDKYARRDTAILHDGGALLESLSPNSNSPDQILEVADGTFMVGTKRKGAAAHHQGTGKLPQRRLWPLTSNWPDSWWDKILRDVQDGMVESIKEVIRGAL